MARILVIDDDKLICRYLRRVLEESGHSVVEAFDGKQGTEICERENIDLVIVDILMPEKDGLETIREVRQTHPETKVIAISGTTLRHMEPLQVAGHLGAEKMLPKPIRDTDLLAAVADVLRAKR